MRGGLRLQPSFNQEDEMKATGIDVGPAFSEKTSLFGPTKTQWNNKVKTAKDGQLTGERNISTGKEYRAHTVEMLPHEKVQRDKDNAPPMKSLYRGGITRRRRGRKGARKTIKRKGARKTKRKGRKGRKGSKSRKSRK
mgnify:CR=1 FL=1